MDRTTSPRSEHDATDPRLARAIEAVDAANAGDPNRIVVDGVEQPKELAHAELMTQWVRTLDPTADDAQLIAARAHHLRRWELPRSSYPEGRAGYLRWRSTLRRRHADAVAVILGDIGYDDGFVDRVCGIVRKEGLGRDPTVQTHEDALCLVFLQTQLDALIGSLGDDATVDVVRKSMAKMSSPALGRATELSLSSRGRAVLGRAAAPDG
ncbi:MAG: DUF4202 domain-containing protein [Actinomycetota bacterium]|nr:DUF4202 domain-containing protein [Actinomycetota bacterium]